MTFNKKNTPWTSLAALLAFVLAAALFSSVFLGCAKKQAEDKKKLTITATFYPLYVMLLNITEGADVQLAMLAPPNTGCLHDYQLTTQDMSRIQSTTILVVNGSGMETFLDKAIESRAHNSTQQNFKMIVSTEGYPLLDGNPHIWVSPKGAMYQVKKIADSLAALDTKNSSLYTKNAEQYIAKIQALSDEMHQALDPFAQNNIVTFHEAFPYFAQEFNLNIAGIIESEPGTEPTAQELLEIISRIQQIQLQGKSISLFAEIQYSPAAAEIIARETKLPLYQLDPAVTTDKSITDPQNADFHKNSWLLAMKNNKDVLLDALSKEKN